MHGRNNILTAGGDGLTPEVTGAENTKIKNLTAFIPRPVK